MDKRNPSPHTDYSWHIEGVPQVFVGNNGQYIDVAITPQAFYQTINYVLTYSNPCGVNHKYGWVQVPPCNHWGHLLVSPNPAEGIINVQLEDISPNYSGAPMVIIDTYFKYLSQFVKKTKGRI